MRYLLALGMLLSVAFCSAQNPEYAAKCDEIMGKVERLDIINYILPLLLEKDQIKAILPSIEKARENVRIAQKKEYEELKKIEPELNKMLSEAETKEEVPKREFISAAYATIQKLYMARKIIAQMNTDLVMEAFKKVANAGQIKAATNSLSAAQIGGKPEDLTDEMRLTAFVSNILLHPAGYEALRRLAVKP